MFDKLRQLEERYAELHRRLSEPQVIGQASEYARIAKAAPDLAVLVNGAAVVEDGQCNDVFPGKVRRQQLCTPH